MKKFRLTIYLLLFVILATIAWFSVRKSLLKSTFKPDETGFIVEDTSSLNKIFFADKKGNRILLERKEVNNWMVNQTYPVRTDLINLTLTMFKTWRIQSPATKLARENVIKIMAAEGVKVELYAGGKLNKTFYIGETTPDQLGTYALMEGSENPYILQLPGWDVNLRNRFFMDVLDWKNRVVFNTKPENLSLLEVRYPKDTSSSFSFQLIENEILFNGGKDKHYNKELANNYLNYFQGLYLENFYPENQKNRTTRDSLIQQTPDCNITLKDKKNQGNLIKIYFIKDNPDRMYALLGEKNEFVSIQTYVFNKILVKRSAFMKGI